MQVEELQASINLSTRRAATGTAVWNGWSDNKDPPSRSHKSTIFYDITACYQNYGLVGANYTICQIWTTRLNNRFWSCLCAWIEYYWCQDSAFVLHLFYVWPSIFWYVYYVFTIFTVYLHDNIVRMPSIAWFYSYMMYVLRLIHIYTPCADNIHGVFFP